MKASEIAELEDRIIAAERELRTIRAMLAAATRCTCPIGFGTIRSATCPKHGCA